MSGIYIHGMEMPATYPLTVTIYPDGQVLSETVGAKDKHGIVIPVPEHGDLIERKAIYLTDFEIAMCGGDYKEGMKMLLEKIESAPVIISAGKEN